LQQRGDPRRSPLHAADIHQALMSILKLPTNRDAYDSDSTYRWAQFFRKHLEALVQPLPG
jgi:hypothetical protein